MSGGGNGHYMIDSAPEQKKRANIQKMTIDINVKMRLSSDIYFRIKNRGNFKNKLICRFALNTSFIHKK